MTSYGTNKKLSKQQPEIFLSTLVHTTNRTFIHTHSEKFFYVYLDFGRFCIEALFDTGAFSSAMSLTNFEKIRFQFPHLVKSQSESITKTIKMADGTSTYIFLKCSLMISIGGHTFQENFLVLPQLNSTLLGKPFFKNHEIVFCPSRGLLCLLDYAFTKPQKTAKTIEKIFILENLSRISIAAHQQEILECKLNSEKIIGHLANAIRIIEPSIKFEPKIRTVP